MQLDRLALQLRPRSMAEAGDLGVRLAQASRRDLLRCWLPVWALTTALALATVAWASWLPGLLLFWLKPWLDRTLLQVYARSAFGRPTRLADLWRDADAVWWRGLLHSLTLARLSPWRAYTAPARQLEGQRGSALRQRVRLLLRGQRGPVSLAQAAFAQAEAVLVLGAMSGIALALPGVQFSDAVVWWFGDDGLAPAFAAALVYALAVAVVEPFHVAAGFTMYLNRRVALEAWDIEQAFRHAFAR